MKPFISLLMILLFANFSNAQSPEDYNKLWKEVSDFERKGLPKSALKVVESIEKKAKASHNTPQEIKTLLFRSKYALILEEDAQFNIINEFKTVISKSEAPTKNVLQNMLATLYWQYFNQNRWKFYNRTKTSEKVDETDFRTWDLQTLFDDIHSNYQQSLQNGLILQQTPLKDYEAILVSEPDSKLYRPTLFDLLAHNALAFYKTDETNIAKPAYKFEIDNPDLLSPYKSFITLKLDAKDSTSLQLNALKIYQDLLKFHRSDASPKALVDVDVERLFFTYQNATFDDKQDVLLKVLKDESAHWHKIKSDVAALYDFEIAKIYVEQGHQYDPKKEDNNFRWKFKQALELCESAIKGFPGSKGAQKCEVLKNQILAQSLQITTENFVPIETHSLALIRYKNIADIDFKIGVISDPEDIKIIYSHRKDMQFDILNRMQAIHSWTAKLKDENDYQTHSTEIAVPKLKNGRYFIFGKVQNSNNTYAFKEIQATNIAYIQKEQKEVTTYQVINRANGNPIANAKITYSYIKDYQGDHKTNTYTTDTKGEFHIKRKVYRRNSIKLKIESQDDIAYFENLYVNRYYNNRPSKNQAYKGFLFTDRSIYRPGQTLYFKGITMVTRDNKSMVTKDQAVNVTLYNTNGEEVKKLELTTNDFGSVSGEFILPNTGLTGHFSLRLTGGNNLNVYHSFSVEEYKRPKFEATFKPVSKTYKINDTISVNGNALAYAGSNITDAKVVYRVHRKVRYPNWYYWYRPYFNSEPQEITHGETTTDASGNFEIKFKAIPDESVDKASQPIFNYEVIADITDINGETRSTTTTVKVGYHALVASVTVTDRLDKNDKKNQINIDTRNLNGEFAPATGSVKIYKLKAPNSVLRTRPWPAPDYVQFTKEEFKTLFPNEAFSNEHNVLFWEKGEMVYSKAFDTEKSKALELGRIKRWKSGKYLVILESKDRFGQNIKDEARFSLYSDNDKHLADHQLFSVSTNKSSYKINDTVELTLGSSANIYVTVDIEKNHEIIDTQIIHLNNNKKTINIPVTRNDLGGFAIHYTYAFQNTHAQSTLTISVPYPKTDLDIETLTFRDKLQPGVDETWRFKIKGPKGDKVAAELLASMYDMSLDQFKAHQWHFNPISNRTYYSSFRPNYGRSFSVQQFRVENLKRDIGSYHVQNYDRLNFFGLYFSHYYYGRQQYLKRLKHSIPSTYTSKTIKSQKKGIIKGIVYDNEGIPLPAANILIKGTSTGTTTDFDGNFSLKAKKGDELVITYIGYKSLNIKISEDNYFTITLYEDGDLLDEVVVVAEQVSQPRAESGILNLISMDDEADKDSFGFETNGKFKTSGNKNFRDGDSRSTEAYKKEQEKKDEQNFDDVKIRKNLQETAFFFPQLQTDKDGNVSFSFTTPESLTKWKLQLLAHTKTLDHGTMSLETVTQKELMVLPNVPRFLREGDQITVSTKIANLTDKELKGVAVLQLFDALTGKSVDSELSNAYNELSFTVSAEGNTSVSWNLDIPFDIDAVQYKIIAKAGDFSDGEQNALPVLSNRMLVTETLPMWIKSNETRTFTLDKLKNVSSSTLRHQKLTFEMTSNPAWYAVQALPYLMEYPYECNEQTFSRYYANALASHIAHSNPRIQEVFNQWRNTDALLSNLEKNQELKSILIQETPWLRDAQSETEQKKRIALLFDLNKMNNELAMAKNKLKNGQMANGAWPWFNGGRPSRYITQHIITGFGHLNKLGVTTSEESSMITKALNYLDAEFVQEYKDLKKYNPDVDLSKDHLSYTQLHYLYMRSFYPEIDVTKEVQTIIDYYQTQIQKYWLSRSLYAKGLMALVTHRMDDKSTAESILKSLRETSITSEELGMYWKANTSSWYWYQAPIETQALLIEAFSDIENDTATIDNLKIWLLKNKQTNRWQTTKATTDAIYALLLQGSDWLSVTDMVDIVLGGQAIEPSKLEDVKVEAGTGYFKTSWSANEITPEMATVKLTKKGDGIAWGGLYWQYFEDLDKITSAETPLKLKKKLFKKVNTDTGEEITEITKETELKVGDLVRVRIELRSDRAMEFVHMKDMRAAGLEPINVLSHYKYQDGLGYYESTKDAATNFFFDYLPKGVYVFEYDLRVNNAGHMSNGITTIQSMYAPEFSSHSEGLRISVEND
ncbi:carboxypeptidase-like regulatory domain-containing protein [uncultured Psychroserpens sp.]|uniref:alpha-2-macroglobulin family protein n=1 Tax=uncultured Psychroserpens sp. TaxID=255436 RepID=UPI002628523F|nr:carboxypeptidase-like regulatory domain-containing protein [uncultured Psychroserpens sp.]